MTAHPLRDFEPVPTRPGTQARDLIATAHGVTSFFLVELRMEQGASVPLHTHPIEEAWVVTSGALTVRIGDETHEGPAQERPRPNHLQRRRHRSVSQREYAATPRQRLQTREPLCRDVARKPDVEVEAQRDGDLLVEEAAQRAALRRGSSVEESNGTSSSGLSVCASIWSSAIIAAFAVERFPLFKPGRVDSGELIWISAWITAWSSKRSDVRAAALSSGATDFSSARRPSAVAASRRTAGLSLRSSRCSPGADLASRASPSA